MFKTPGKKPVLSELSTLYCVSIKAPKITFLDIFDFSSVFQPLTVNVLKIQLKIYIKLKQSFDIQCKHLFTAYSSSSFLEKLTLPFITTIHK